MDARLSLGLLAVIILAVSVGVIAANSQPRTVAAPAPTITPTPFPTPQVNHINIVSNPSGNPSASYAPTRLEVRVGTEVTWVNISGSAQTVIADSGAFTSKPLSSGETFRWKPTKPGTYFYGSYLNPDMRGVVVVVP